MYKVKLDQFEGPLDLLLFFIKRDELNIYDIPIAHITKEFLDYVRFIQQLDLEVAGEFIYTAAWLIQIKSKMMLPREPSDDDETVEDPRTELVQRLLEYKRFKEMAGELQDFELNETYVYKRLFFEGEHQLAADHFDPEMELTLKDITLWDLMLVYKRALQQMPKQTFHEIKKINVTIEDQVSFVKEWLATKERFAFTEILKSIPEKIVVVITFLAILEMTKLQQISLYITETLTDFYIVRKETPVEPVEGEISNYD